MADVITPSFGGNGGGGGPTIAELRLMIEERNKIIGQQQLALEEARNKLAALQAVSEMLQLQLIDLIKNQEANAKASQLAIKNLQEILKRLPK